MTQNEIYSHFSSLVFPVALQPDGFDFGQQSECDL